MLSRGLSAAAAVLLVTAVIADDPSACAAVASASSSYFSAHPPATGSPRIPAKIAQDCLNSVPNYKDPALALTNGLKSWFEIQSTIDYLKNPLSGYLWPSIDMVGQLDVILDNINNGKYNSEYDFQMDLFAYNYLTRDFHFGFHAELFTKLEFLRLNHHLISLSSDGKAFPDVWRFEDLFRLDKDRNIIPTGCKTCSPVTQINGMDVQDFLTYTMNVVRSHDPDAMYNQIMFNPAFDLNPAGGPGSPWNIPQWYAGPDTTITFQNRTSLTFQNSAALVGDWTGIETGDDVYQAFCVPEDSSSDQTSTKRDVIPDNTKRAADPPAVTALPSYPDPVAIDPSGALSGYYLQGDFDNVAVLVVRAFEMSTKNFMTDFQDTLSAFFAKTTKDKMEYLVLDFQGNGGGFIDLGIEFVAQLFPHDEPNSKTTMRQSSGLSAVITKFGQIQDAFDKNSSTEDALTQEDNNTPWAFQSVIDATADAIQSNEAYLTSPYTFDGANFTAFFQNNYTNTNPSDSGGEITITSTNERTGFSQPFSAENIIILTDGYCGSTCTVVSEMLKNLHGVQFITVGGRPQAGPMQPLGNSKGSQVFDVGELQMILDAWYDDSQFPIARNTLPKNDPFANDQWNYFALDRGLSRLNGRNTYRIGDDSVTLKQMIYEASDCRMWYTADMISDPTVLWSQTADLAFNKRDGKGLISSSLCIADSVGHPTSGSGGLKRGQVGPQNPPAGAASKFPWGWLLNGNTVVNTWSPNRVDGGGVGVVDGVAPNQDPKTFYLIGNSTQGSGDADTNEQTDDDDDLSLKDAQEPLNALQSVCQGYNGDKWLMVLLCNMYG